MSKVIESPRSNCVLGGINTVLSSINKFCPIYHSGPGCCLQTTIGVQGNGGGRFAHFVAGVSIPCSNMVEKEVVFGGEDKLRSVIQGAIEIIDADAFFVLVGCTAGIIGEDVEDVVKGFQEEGHRVYAINTPGFLGDTNLGYEAAFEALIHNIVEPGLPKKENLVNLFGIIPHQDPLWEGNLEELTRILNRLGLEVNTFFTQEQGYDEIRTSSQAALNIIVNPWLLKDSAKEYEECFGVPSLRFAGLPIGASDTSDFIRQVGRALNLEECILEKVINSEERYFYNYIRTAIGAVRWKRYAVVGDANIAIGITRFLANEYSYTPVATIISESIWRESDKERIVERLSTLDYSAPPEIHFEADDYKISKILDNCEELHLIAGSSNEKEIAIRKGIQISVVAFPITDRLIFNKAYAGYRGALSLLEDLYTPL